MFGIQIRRLITYSIVRIKAATLLLSVLRKRLQLIKRHLIPILDGRAIQILSMVLVLSTLQRGFLVTRASLTLQRAPRSKNLLKLTTDTKYNNTVGVEVLDESLSTAGAWYDNNYNQSPLNKVTKTTNTLKGKSSVQYDVTNSGVNSKLYLFGVGDKTYSFWSVNEQLNTQADSNYWTAFSKVFDSFQIQ
jgi:hypothetical protein